METISRSIPSGWQVSFYRSVAGAEMDLVLESPVGTRYGIEIKFSLNPALGKGFHNSAADLKTQRNFVIYPGDRIVPLDDLSELVPLENFVTGILPSLGVHTPSNHAANMGA